MSELALTAALTGISTLATGIDADATEIRVAAGDGDLKFPALAEGDFNWIKITQGANSEVVKAYWREHDVFRVIRGQQCTAARSFTTGATITVLTTALALANVAASRPPSVSADKGDADATLVANVDETTVRWATTLTANRTVTLSTTGAVNGNKFRIVRTGLGAYTLAVGGLKTIANSTAAFVDVEYNGSAWVLTGYGAL